MGIREALDLALCTISDRRARDLRKRTLAFDARKCGIDPPNETETAAIAGVWAHMPNETAWYDALQRIVQAHRMERFQRILTRCRYWQRMVAEYDADVMPYSHAATILRLRRFATLLWNWIDTQSDPEALWRELAEAAPDAFVDELDVNSLMFHYRK